MCDKRSSAMAFRSFRVGRPFASGFAWGALWCLVAGACGDGVVKPVAESTMVEVSVEMHLLQARESVARQPLVGLRDSILARHGLDAAGYAEAVAWYSAHPDQWTAVYEQVVDRLSVGSMPSAVADSVGR